MIAVSSRDPVGLLIEDLSKGDFFFFFNKKEKREDGIVSEGERKRKREQMRMGSEEIDSSYGVSERRGTQLQQCLLDFFATFLKQTEGNRFG